MGSVYPEDRSGIRIARGDLVLYDGAVWKVVGWSQGISGYNINIKQRVRGKTVSRTTCASRVDDLGADTITGISSKDVTTPKKPKYKIGQRVRLKESGLSGTISKMNIYCVEVEVWDATGFCVEDWDYDEIEPYVAGFSPRIADYDLAMTKADEAFGTGTGWRGKMGIRSFGGRSGNGNGEKSREKDSISRQELLRDEVNRLRRERIVDEQQPKKKPKKSKAKKDQVEEEKKEQPKSKLPVRRREW